MKDIYVDVKALLKDGRRVIIEMQVLNVEGFEKRKLYYAAKTYSQQLMSGKHKTPKLYWKPSKLLWSHIF